MEPFFSTYLADQHFTFLVIFWATLSLFTAAIVFLTYTYIKRALRLKKEEFKIHYQQVFDGIVFEYLFGMTSLDATVEKLRQTKLATRPLFQKVALKSIISLHRNYGSEQRTALSEFYRASGLSDYSLRKVASGKWVRIAEGIRDLSAFRLQEAAPVIEQQLRHKHPVVRTEALLGMVKLKGLNILTPEYLPEHPNDWVQATILHLTKMYKLPPPDPDHLEKLINSTDYSWQLLGLRLVDHFQDYRYMEMVRSMTQVPNQKLSEKSKGVYDRLVEFSKNKT